MLSVYMSMRGTKWCIHAYEREGLNGVYMPMREREGLNGVYMPMRGTKWCIHAYERD